MANNWRRFEFIMGDEEARQLTTSAASWVRLTLGRLIHFTQLALTFKVNHRRVLIIRLRLLRRQCCCSRRGGGRRQETSIWQLRSFDIFRDLTLFT